MYSILQCVVNYVQVFNLIKIFHKHRTYFLLNIMLSGNFSCLKSSQRLKTILSRKDIEAPAECHCSGSGPTGGIDNSAPEVSQEERLAKAGRGVTHSGVPGAPAFKTVIPGNGMIAAHRSPMIAGLVNGEQDVDLRTRIAREVVPLVGTRPDRRQHRGRGMVTVLHMHRRRRDLRMT